MKRLFVFPLLLMVAACAAATACPAAPAPVTACPAAAISGLL
jgi:hypothetical protein